MTTYRIQFLAVVEREVEVPNDLTWAEAYGFVRDQLGWDQVAHSAASRTTIDTTRTQSFNSVDYLRRLRERYPQP